MTDYEALLDYRRAVAKLYHDVRHSKLPAAETWSRFRAGRDALFADHPQSALSLKEQRTFRGLQYYPYNPALRLYAPIEPDPRPETISVALRHDGETYMRRFGRVHLMLSGEQVSLALYWIEGYGGGLFLPFRDATSGETTYGGGRYLLDTIKHADLGNNGSQLILDFNYAYNPSCAYDDRWSCPLAPIENRLPIPVEAGELAYR